MKTIVITLFFLILNYTSCFSQENGYGTEFHDFVTDFTQISDTQVYSISFPLLYISENEQRHIEKKDWKLIDYCFGCEYSPILFMGKPTDFQAGYYKIIGDTDYVISAYTMLEKKIENFYFKKSNSKFQLYKIFLNQIQPDSLESFFVFIDNFAKDTGFVRQRIAENFIHAYWDTTLTDTAEFPLKMDYFVDHEYLFKRIYIDNLDLKSNDISLYIRGEGTCYMLEYSFKRINRKWFLVKLITR